MSRVQRDLVSKDLYKSYVLHMRAAGAKPIPWKNWIKVVRVMGTVLCDHILESGIVGLPQKHGDVFIRDRPQQHTKFFGVVGADKKSVIHFNDHSDGKIKKIYWHNRYRKNKKGSVWLFGPHRTLRRSLAKQLKSGVIYPDFTKLLKIS